MYIYLFCQNRTIKLFDFYLPSHTSPISSVSPIICVGNNSGAHRITIPQSLTLTLLVWSLLSWITFMDRIGFCPSFSANFLPVLLLLLYIWQIDIGPSNIFQFGGCPWPLAHISGWLSWHLICAPGLSRRIDWTQLILFCPRHILRTTQLTFQRANNTFTSKLNGEFHALPAPIEDYKWIQASRDVGNEKYPVYKARSVVCT